MLHPVDEVNAVLKVLNCDPASASNIRRAYAEKLGYNFQEIEAERAAERKRGIELGIFEDHTTSETEELDVMVLSMIAIDAYLQNYSPKQRDKMMPHVRGLAAYEACRPASRRQSNVVDFEGRLIHSRISKAVAREHRSALAEGLSVYQHGVNEFGDIVHAYDID